MIYARIRGIPDSIFKILDGDDSGISNPESGVPLWLRPKAALGAIQRLTDESLTAPSTLVVAKGLSALDFRQGQRGWSSGSLTTTREELRELTTFADGLPTSLVVVDPSITRAGGSQMVPDCAPAGVGTTVAHGGAP
jgi:hypothetical protein